MQLSRRGPGPRSSPWPWLGALVLLAAAVARLVLLSRFPLLLTNDSPDYLLASRHLATSLDFASRNLRDWRLPGYPLWLALLRWVPGWSSTGLAVAQAAMGLTTTALSLEVGRRLGGRWSAVLLGTFVGLNPLYLLFEHMVMVESLFLLLLWGFTLAWLVGWQRPGEIGPGVAAGLLLAGCILTRPDGLVPCAVLVVTLPVLLAARGRRRTRLHPVVGWTLAAVFPVLLLDGAWAYRNQVVLGEVLPFTASFSRQELLFYAQYEILDPDLPSFDGYRWDAGQPNESAYALLHAVNLTPDPRAEAARLLAGQRAAHPWRFLAQVGRSFGHFFGLPAPGAENEHDVMQFWVGAFLTDLPRLHRQNHAMLTASEESWYRGGGRSGRVLAAWQAVSLAYLRWGRRVLAASFAVACAILLARIAGRSLPRPLVPAVVVAAALLLTAAAHALLLADHDRFSTPFEGYQVLVIAAVVGRLRPGGGGQRPSPEPGSKAATSRRSRSTSSESSSTAASSSSTALA